MERTIFPTGGIVYVERCKFFYISAMAPGREVPRDLACSGNLGSTYEKQDVVNNR